MILKGIYLNSLKLFIFTKFLSINIKKKKVKRKFKK